MLQEYRSLQKEALEVMEAQRKSLRRSHSVIQEMSTLRQEKMKHKKLKNVEMKPLFLYSPDSRKRFFDLMVGYYVRKFEVAA